nr:MAG TPA: hypothetical protein [Caudoviricetes sp.]
MTASSQAFLSLLLSSMFIIYNQKKNEVETFKNTPLVILKEVFK